MTVQQAKRTQGVLAGAGSAGAALAGALLALSAAFLPCAQAQPSERPPLRFLVPHSAFAHPGDREQGLATAVQEYNLRHRPVGAAPVQLIQRGDNFSSLKDTMALFLAGDTPEIATIESSELPAIERAHLPKRIPTALITALQSRRPKQEAHALPFQLSLPILIADQEILFRAHADQAPLPTLWKDLVQLARNLALTDPSRVPLLLPLQGARGLWIFEALSGKPLWTREAGGLKANRELESPIETLRSLLQGQVALATSDTSWERATQDFIDRKSPLLVTSLDSLPLIARKAQFRWKAGALPTLSSAHSQGSDGSLLGGSQIVVTRDSPDVWSFLKFLYSKEGARHWAIPDGFVPLQADWQNTAEWKNASSAYRSLALQGVRSHSVRTTDPDVVRAHTEWIAALHSLFGETSRRLPVESVFTQLDSTLTVK